MKLYSVAALLHLLLAVVLVGCERKKEPPPDHPRLTTNIRMQDVTFYSAALDRDMPYRVVLPTIVPSEQKLPVIYLLHGGGGGYRDWSNYSDVARYAEGGVILVMPEGNSSYYVNAAKQPNDRFEDYIVHDVFADVERRFPASTGRANRAIVGISMGGFGAITLALKYPDLFAFAGGLSSAIDVPSRPFSYKRIGQYLDHRRIFGAWDSQSRRDNDPFVLARSIDPSKVPYFFLSCGEQEGLLPANKKFAAILKTRGFEYEFHSGPGGHDWNQWNRRLPDVFESLLHNLKKPG